jgi:hypothetical protein
VGLCNTTKEQKRTKRIKEQKEQKRGSKETNPSFLLQPENIFHS